MPALSLRSDDPMSMSELLLPPLVKDFSADACSGSLTFLPVALKSTQPSPLAAKMSSLPSTRCLFLPILASLYGYCRVLSVCGSCLLVSFFLLLLRRAENFLALGAFG